MVRDAYGCDMLRYWWCELLPGARCVFFRLVRDARVITLKNRRMWCEMRMGATCGVAGCEMRMGCELLRVRDARVITLKNRRMWCEMRSGATCGVVGARCVWVRDAPNNVISVLGVRVAAWCEMRIFLDWCESLCPP